MSKGGSHLTKDYQTANAMLVVVRSQTARQTARDKLGSQKGNSPDLQLRSRSAC